MELFRKRLSEAIAWCSRLVPADDVEGSLRTPELWPESLYVAPKETPGAAVGAPWRAQRARQLADEARRIRARMAIVETLASGRTALLREGGLYPRALAADLAGGRLLVYVPDLTVSDGGPAAQSQGFLALDNTPPWDAWVQYVLDQPARDIVDRAWLAAEHVDYRDLPMYSEYLVTWAPPWAVDLVEQGLAVNPDPSLAWLDATDTDLARQLREARWL